jgi:hypothetical protein
MNIFDLRKWGVGLLAVLLLSFAATGFAQKVTDYTADQVTMSADGKPVSQSKVYFSGGKMRLDDAMPQSGAKLVIIYRSDLKKNFMLNTDKKTYTERDLDEKDLNASIMSMGSVKNRKEKALGEEAVNGYKCSKKEIEAEIEVMGFKNTSRSVVWQSPKFDLPLRTRSDSGQITELRNIREEKPAAAVFEIPAGYSKVSDMMELMGDARPKGRRPPKSLPTGKESTSPFPTETPPGLKLPLPKP